MKWKETDQLGEPKTLQLEGTLKFPWSNLSTNAEFLVHTQTGMWPSHFWQRFQKDTNIMGRTCTLKSDLCVSNHVFLTMVLEPSTLELAGKMLHVPIPRNSQSNSLALGWSGTLHFNKLARQLPCRPDFGNTFPRHSTSTDTNL